MKDTATDDVTKEVCEMLKYYSDTWREMQWGDVRESTCYKCGARILISRAKCNGHIHMWCKECGWGLMQ